MSVRCTGKKVWVLLLLWPAMAYAVERGDVAPDFDLPQLSPAAATGYSLLQFSDYRGQFVYLDFWQSDCASCRDGMAFLEELQREFDGQGFQVLGVTTDRYPTDALMVLEDVGVSYPVVSDLTGQVAQAYGLEVLPTGVLVDREGAVRWVHQGFQTADRERIRAGLGQLMSASLLNNNRVEE